MNINYKETQYNFFENAAVSSNDPRSPRVMAAQLTLSIENLVIFAIISIMVLLFCFSLGVERGKRLALSEVKGADSAVGQPQRSLSGQDVAAEDDGEVDSGAAKKNIFASFWAPREVKEQPVSPAESIPSANPSAEMKAVRGGPSPTAVTNKVKGETARQPAAAVRASVTGSAYTVQVASYKSEKWANKEAASLKQKGYRDVYVVPKGSFVIVCVGSFPNKTDASTLTRQLKSRYQDPVVRRL